MDIDIVFLRQFFFWCMIINSAIYLFTAFSLIVFRGFVYNILGRLFDIDDAIIGASIQKYLGNFKLLITFFNFTPWIVLLILTK